MQIQMFKLYNPSINIANFEPEARVAEPSSAGGRL
jgi:hypothetical protein